MYCKRCGRLMTGPERVNVEFHDACYAKKLERELTTVTQELRELRQQVKDETPCVRVLRKNGRFHFAGGKEGSGPCSIATTTTSDVLGDEVNRRLPA